MLYEYAKFEDLKGKVLKNIEHSEESMTFFTEDGLRYVLYHEQDSCEHVYIDDICGDLDDLIGKEILVAEEITNFDESNLRYFSAESYTWTFYKIATMSGYVVIRWLGCSNGYCSESVDFALIKEE